MRVTSDIETDIAIVGAGAVGSVLALRLARDAPELQVTLVDPAGLQQNGFQTGQAYDPRVVALNAQSQSMLIDLGLWQGLLATRVCPYRTMQVWDGEGTGSIEFHAADVHAASLGYIVENNLLTGALHHSLAGLTNLNCIEARVVAQQCHGQERQWLLSDGRRLQAPLLVGADGAGSKVRELAGFEVRQWPYAQSAVVTTARFARTHRHTARQWFTDFGPLALLPLAGGGEHCCALVWSVTESRAAQLLALADEAFATALARASEHSLGEVLYCDQRHRVPLRQLHVTRYHQARTVLVGDAAHTIHPLAGQGVNLGLRDAAVLAAELARARTRGISLAEAASLRRYQRRVQTYNLAAMAAMEAFNRAFLERHPAARVVRNWGLGKVGRLLPLKRELMRIAAGDRFNA